MPGFAVCPEMLEKMRTPGGWLATGVCLAAVFGCSQASAQQSLFQRYSAVVKLQRDWVGFPDLDPMGQYRGRKYGSYLIGTNETKGRNFITFTCIDGSLPYIRLDLPPSTHNAVARSLGASFYAETRSVVFSSDQARHEFVAYFETGGVFIDIDFTSDRELSVLDVLEADEFEIGFFDDRIGPILVLPLTPDDSSLLISELPREFKSSIQTYDQFGMLKHCLEAY